MVKEKNDSTSGGETDGRDTHQMYCIDKVLNSIF